MKNKRITFILLPLFAAVITAAIFFNPPYGLENRIPNTSLLVNGTGQVTQMELVEAFPNLSFDFFVHIWHPNDGSNRIVVVEKSGVIKIFPNVDTVTTASVFLDIVGRVNSGPGEAGLLSIAFHPDYAANGKFYVYYTHGNLVSRISEFSVTSNPDVADPNSERILMELSQPYSNHNGGQLAFGNDGMLYISLGDGGSGGDPLNSGQDRTTLLGNILRIDVDAQSGGLQYAIPPDNPFVGNTQGWREEIWAYGLRNPWRFSFDRDAGTLWAADVGQNAWEEIDVIVKGGNYGWRIMEGTHCYSTPNCDTAGLILPVYEYSHSIGNSITGGYVYRGFSFPQLLGLYIYGDYGTRKIWGLTYENGQVTNNTLLAQSPAGITSFGEDENGEIYIAATNGKIYTFKDTSSTTAGGPPDSLSESGLYSNIANRTLSPGLIPYTVNSVLWSDNAYKERVIALPETTKIDFSENGFWDFPGNTVLVKSFLLEMERGNPASERIVETRFLVKRENSTIWDGYSYKWNDDETEAVLLTDSSTKTFTITDPGAPGGSYAQTWYFPNRTECIRCHTDAAGYVLGVRTAQMNKQHMYGSVSDNQIRSYNHIRLFTTEVSEDSTDHVKIPNPLDDTKALYDRAKSYLDANCSMCHRPNGTGRSNMDLRYDTPLQDMHIVSVSSTFGDLGLSQSYRVLPEEPDSSTLYLRLLHQGEFRMPPLATSMIDSEAASIIRDWIASIRSSQAYISYNDYWNMVSLPAMTGDNHPDSLFPGRSSDVFSYDGSYTAVTTLQLGAGYWVKMPAGDSTLVEGYLTADSSLAVTEGWNLIGVQDIDIAASQITSNPPGIIISDFYNYSAGYDVQAVLEAGNGYWVKCSQAGVIYLPNAPAPPNTTIQIDRKNCTNITVSDAAGNSMLLSLAGEGASNNNYPLPPKPPEGSFDARFANDLMIEQLTGEIQLLFSSSSYPVTILVHCGDLHIKDAVDGSIINRLVKDGGSLVISNPNITSVIISEPGIPSFYRLYQNYPNPFNPSTTIEFALPEANQVTIELYTVTGEKVMNIVEADYSAGYHQMEFDAGDLSSGVYLYKIAAGSFISVKKMLLLK